MYQLKKLIHMSYKILMENYEKCLNRYGDTNRGVDWPNKHDASSRCDAMIDITKSSQKKKINQIKILEDKAWKTKLHNKTLKAYKDCKKIDKFECLVRSNLENASRNLANFLSYNIENCCAIINIKIIK